VCDGDAEREKTHSFKRKFFFLSTREEKRRKRRSASKTVCFFLCRIFFFIEKKFFLHAHEIQQVSRFVLFPFRSIQVTFEKKNITMSSRDQKKFDSKEKGRYDPRDDKRVGSGDKKNQKCIERDTYYTRNNINLLVNQGNNGYVVPQFEPQYVYWVARQWPAGVDKKRFFTTITDALAAVAALGPSVLAAVRPVIWVAPGDYRAEGVLQLVSNIALRSWGGERSTFIAGLSWIPSFGINAPQAGLTEAVTVNGFSAGLADLVVDYSFKNSGFALFEIYDSFWAAGLNVIGNPANFLTEAIARNTDFLGGVFRVADVGAFTFVSGEIAPAEGNVLISVVFDAVFVAVGVFGQVEQTGSGNVFYTGVRIGAGLTVFAPDLIISPPVAVLRGSTVYGVIFAGANTIVDTLYSAWEELSGEGRVERSIDADPTVLPVYTVTVPGETVTLALDPPTAGQYQIVVHPQNALAIDTNPLIDSRTETSFDITTSGATPAGAAYSFTFLQSSLASSALQALGAAKSAAAKAQRRKQL
jgi:hypothetical protein